MPSNSKENGSKDTHKIPKNGSQNTVAGPKKVKPPLKDSHNHEKAHSPFDNQVYPKQNSVSGPNEATTSVESSEVITLKKTTVLPTPPTPPTLSMVPKKIQQHENSISEKTSNELFAELATMKITCRHYYQQHKILVEKVKKLEESESKMSENIEQLEAMILKLRGTTNEQVNNQEGSPLIVEDDEKEEEDRCMEVLESRENSGAPPSKKRNGKHNLSVEKSKIAAKNRLGLCPLCGMTNHTLADCNRYESIQSKYKEMRKRGLCTNCGARNCKECPFDSIPCPICKDIPDVRVTNHMPELCFYHEIRDRKSIPRNRRPRSSVLQKKHRPRQPDQLMQNSEMQQSQFIPTQAQFVPALGYPQYSNPQYVYPPAATIPFQQPPQQFPQQPTQQLQQPHPQEQVYAPQTQYPHPLVYQPMYPYPQPPSQ